jgi:hypothetical protein
VRHASVILFASALFAAAGCGSTNGTPAGGGSAANGAAEQDTGEQPGENPLSNPAYLAANNVCSLFPLEELARQNNVKPTKQAVAKKIAASEAAGADREQAFKGCMDALDTE